jgi:hypothetical protein
MAPVVVSFSSIWHLQLFPSVPYGTCSCFLQLHMTPVVVSFSSIWHLQLFPSVPYGTYSCFLQFHTPAAKITSLLSQV